MKLFFEGQSYKTALLTEWFKDTPFYIKHLKGQQGKSSLECVGYYYNASKGEHCFALPKVFFFNDKPFGTDEIVWEDGIDLKPSHKRDVRFQDWEIDFLYELPIKLYSAIDIYSKKKDSKQVSQDSELLEVSSSKDKKNLSLLDITFAIRDFYYEHEDLFVFIYKETHKGYNKVNWSKTVRKQTPYIDGDNIVYPLVNNRRKGVNYEEELLILFFNTLRYIDSTIVRINIQDTEYELFPDLEFKRMMDNGVVVRNLMEIQENYYNETLIELWNLLYMFHSKSHHSGHGGKKKDDYLLVHKFNIVFEDMIDELLNPCHEEEYKFAKQTEREKKQDDGKIIDHLFKHTSLINDAEKVYYIGDSKYYKDGATPEGPSLYKQYTYAKNIVQSQIDWFYAERSLPSFNRYIKYRDERTEGYTITPNFFITGNVEKSSTWKDDELKRTPNPEHLADETKPEFIEFEQHYQFEDRLFDRDTLFLLQYDINFMFVLNAYVNKNKGKNKAFFDKAKKQFKDDFTSYIADQYTFFVLKHKQNPALYGMSIGTHVGIEVAIDKYFRKLSGKVFCPSSDSDLMILALQKDNGTLLQEQQDLITNISAAFEIYPYKFGDNPEASLQESSDAIPVERVRRIIADEEDDFGGIAADETNIESRSDIAIAIEHSISVVESQEGTNLEESRPVIIWDDADVDEEDKYVRFLPLYSIQAACGRFLDVDNEVHIMGWVDIEAAGIHHHGAEYYIVQALGESMLPRIQDGEYCVFRAGGSINNGNIVIAGIHDQDPCYNGRYTIKEFSQDWVYNEDGVRERQSVTLSPSNDNGDYPTFELDAIRGDGFGVFGVLVETLEI